MATIKISNSTLRPSQEREPRIDRQAVAPQRTDAVQAPGVDAEQQRATGSDQTRQDRQQLPAQLAAGGDQAREQRQHQEATAQRERAQHAARGRSGPGRRGPSAGIVRAGKVWPSAFASSRGVRRATHARGLRRRPPQPAATSSRPAIAGDHDSQVVRPEDDIGDQHARPSVEGVAEISGARPRTSMVAPSPTHRATDQIDAVRPAAYPLDRPGDRLADRWSRPGSRAPGRSATCEQVARPDDVRRGTEQRPYLDDPGDVQRSKQQRAEVVRGGTQRKRDRLVARQQLASAARPDHGQRGGEQEGQVCRRQRAGSGRSPWSESPAPGSERRRRLPRRA